MSAQPTAPTPTQTTTTANNAKEQKQQQSLWITHVSAVGPYLKICGQLNPIIDLPSQLKQTVLPLCQVIHNSWPIVQKKQHLLTNSTYLVKIINRTTSLGDTELFRARMIRLIETPPPQTILLVEVDFIDMGYSKIVECEELLIAPQDISLMSMPALGSQFIMLGIFADWTPDELENILRLIARQSLSLTVEMELQGHKFITMKWKDWDFGEFLMSQRKIASPINKDFQRDNFLRVLKEHQQENHSGSVKQNNVNNNINSNNNNNNSKNNNNVDYGSKYKHINVSNNAKGPRPPLVNKIVDGVIKMNTALKDQFQQHHQQQHQQYQQQLHFQHQQQKMLQQHHLIRHQAHQNFVPGLVMPPVQRLPRNMTTEFQTFMMGIHQQNNRVPYTGQSTAAAMVAPYVNIGKPLAPTSLRLQRPLANAPIHMFPTNNSVKTENSVITKSSKNLPSSGYKINKFTVGSSYDVCVSFVEKGPYVFSVQLISAQQQLTDMMTKIERIQLQNLTGNITPCMACIARYSEDGQLYRAVVVNSQPIGAQVIYIDYGNSEFVKKNNLYEIPTEFLEERAFALPFALAGLKALGPIDDSLKKTFKEMIVYKNCKLKVTPQEGPPTVQYCELYLQDKNMLEILLEIQKSRLVYPKALKLANNDIVEIRFIDSPRNFHVQKVANIEKFEELMDDMFSHYNANQVVPQHIAVGAAYAVKTDADWYRAEVIRADDTAIIVRLVDFGYERLVTKNLLSKIAEKHLKMPRQAVHCCLKGFESNELSNKEIATTQFEMLAEDSNRCRRSFNVKIFRIEPDELHIVNLFTKELNVMKKLYKLSMPFDQYLSLEKADFHMNGFSGGASNSGSNNQSKRKSKDDNSKTLSTTSSNLGDESTTKSSIVATQNMQQKQMQLQQQQQQEQQQQLQIKTNAYKQKQQQQQQLSPKSTPAQRLQQFGNKNANKNNDWEKNSSASSNRDVKSNASDRQKQSQQQKYQQQQQQGLKQPNQDILNNSFESNDRRSDASSTSNRSRNQRQKDRRQNKDGNSQKTSRLQKQQQQQERSQNAPQGYSQSRRGSLDSQYGAIEDTIAPAVIAALPAQPEVYIPLDKVFPQEPILTPTTENVTICWWISPHQFYTHRKSRAAAFENLMRDIQKFYKKKPLQQLQLKPGSHVIARHRKDDMHYRARIVACNHMLRKYKVHFVDFGNQYTVTSEDIWQVERRFGDFPIMAYYCSFSNIISNYDHLYIIDRMEKYLPNGSPLICEFKEHIDDFYYVNVKLNNVSLLDRLKNDGIVTEISPDLNLELLAGQQIRAKIVSIKNMLNFKIIIEGCDAPLLCCYDDVRFVKSNPDIVQKFKQFYEGKSCVVNIKDVNDNKVILLRPFLPLFKDDIPSYICSAPRIWHKFQAQVVFIASAHRLYVHTNASEGKVLKLLNDMFEYYEKQGSPLTSYEDEKICAAKSTTDSNWYRARLMKSNKSKSLATTTTNTVEVYYIDYGNTELLPRSELKVLESQFLVDKSAYAMEVNLPIQLVGQNTAGKKAKTDETNTAVVDELQQLLNDTHATIQALECRRNHLLAEVLTEDGRNVIDLLIKKKLIKSRELEFMCKQLDKDKSSIFEFIETVDLTLEDEDDTDKRQQVKSPKPSTSRKKKSNGNKLNDEKVLLTETSSKPVNEIESKPINAIEFVQTVKITETESAAAVETLPPPIEVIVQEKEIKTDIEINVEEPKEIVVDSMPIEIETNEVSADSTIEYPVSPISFEDGEMEQAVLSHCDTPAQFFVHPHNKVGQLRKLQENLQIVARSLPPLMNVHNGAHCISLYSVDRQWYRAEIIDAELMVLKFIDFGNTDCVTDTTDIKEMSVFPDIEPLCIPCALPIRPNGTADWVDAANAIFNVSYDKLLYYTNIVQGDHKKSSIINLYIDGENVAKKLIEDGFAKPLELVDSGENCYISHMNNISDFYIQYEKNSKALELIEIYLSETHKLPKITKFVKGKIVAALFHDDEMWYRAKLLRSLPDEQGYEVLFIDYGNTAVTKECRDISVEIGELPALSNKCALYLSNDEFMGWSDLAEEKFAEIAACGETVFNVELREPAADHALVHLFIDSLNINTELEPLCIRRKIEDTKAPELNASFGAQSIATIDMNDCSQLHNGVISYSKGPMCFYIQFGKDSERLDDLISTLNASVGMDTVTGEPKIGHLYAAVFDDDKQLYRARVLKVEEIDGTPSYTVLFVDYGNKAVVSELRILPLDLEQLREFCKCCILKGVDELLSCGGGDKNIVNDAFHEIVDLSQYVIKLSFEPTLSSAESDTKVINLYTPNTNESIFDQVMQRIIEKKAFKVASRQCLISHAATPLEFYVQLQSNLNKLESITNALRPPAMNSLTQLLSETDVKVGELYAVYAEDENCYYRGRIIKKDEKLFEVKLIDYGNQISVQKLATLPDELLKEPALALCCKLAELSIDVQIDQAVLNEYFTALVEEHFGEIFEIEILDENESATEAVATETVGQNAVKLKINGKDLCTKLNEAIKSGIAPQTKVQPILHDCAIVQVNSTTSFYIQLLKYAPEIEKITYTLLDAEIDFPVLTDIKIGGICGAQFPDDGVFYRARIMKIIELVADGTKDNTPQYLVHFIDFGNDSITSNLRELPEDILKQPNYSTHCALETKFKDVEAATTHLQTFIDERYSETFQIEFINEIQNDEVGEQPPKLCRLFNQTKNVANEIETLLKSV